MQWRRHCATRGAQGGKEEGEVIEYSKVGGIKKTYGVRYARLSSRNAIIEGVLA